jgi:hypothetical protein
MPEDYDEIGKSRQGIFTVTAEILAPRILNLALESTVNTFATPPFSPERFQEPC